MNRWWRVATAGLLVFGFAGVLAYGQESQEASRPVRGTGTPGVPSSGAVTIQGVLQGRPVTVDFHHVAALPTLSHVTSVVHVTTGQSPHITTFWVNCGATAAVAVQPKADTIGKRRDLMFYNTGTNNIFLGGTHATVTTTTGFVLHNGTGFTSRLTLENFQGRVDCISGLGLQNLQIMEIWR